MKDHEVSDLLASHPHIIKEIFVVVANDTWHIVNQGEDGPVPVYVAESDHKVQVPENQKPLQKVVEETVIEPKVSKQPDIQQ